MPDNYHWVSADGEDFGRSNSLTYASRMAKRYSYDTSRFTARPMQVVLNFGEPGQKLIEEHSAHPGRRWPED